MTNPDVADQAESRFNLSERELAEDRVRELASVWGLARTNLYLSAPAMFEELRDTRNRLESVLRDMPCVSGLVGAREGDCNHCKTLRRKQRIDAILKAASEGGPSR
jgi:hypothetical protein